MSIINLFYRCASNPSSSAYESSLDQGYEQDGLVKCTDKKIRQEIVAFYEGLKPLFSSNEKKLQREFRLIQDDKEVVRRLQRQMEYTDHQMQKESIKRFSYQRAPSDWSGCEDRVSDYSVGICAFQGRRQAMEDTHLAVSFHLNIAGRTYPIQLFGIFDGHGGEKVAQFIRDNLENQLKKFLIEFNAQGFTDAGIWNALKMTTVGLNCEFKEFHSLENEMIGSTALFVMILENRIWTANVGDSRTILVNNGICTQLSEDAIPSDPRYRKGIKKRGGHLYKVEGFNGLRIDGILSVARAIGDYYLNGANSSRPKITMKSLDEIQPASYLILCCDGVHEVATSKDLAAAIHNNRDLSPSEFAKSIVYSAYMSGSGDNLSSMVIKIK